MIKINLPGHLLIPHVNLKANIIKLLKQSKTNKNCLSEIKAKLKILIYYKSIQHDFSDQFYNKIKESECADFLAFNYEITKNQVSYEYSKNCIQIPSILFNEKKGIEDFAPLDRLMKFYLIKENLDNVFYKLENGFLKLENKFLLVEVVLCGEITDPKWKVMKCSIKTQNDHKDGFLNGIQPYILNNLNLAQVLNFMRYYESAYFANEIIKVIKIHNKIKGDYNNFSLEKYGVVMTGKIINNYLRFSIKSKEIQYCDHSDVIKRFENTVEYELKRKSGIHTLTYSLSDGILYNNNKIEYDDLELEYQKQRENKLFYENIENLFKKYKSIYNYKEISFGNKNILIKKKKQFVCFKLENLTESIIQIKIFSGVFISFNLIDFVELKMKEKDNIITIDGFGSPTNFAINIDQFISFVKNQQSILFNIYKFRKFHVQLKNSFCIRAQRKHILFNIDIKDQIVINYINKTGKNKVHTVMVKNNIEPLKKYLRFIILKETLKDNLNTFNETDSKISSTFNFLNLTISFGKEQLILESNSDIFNLVFQNLTNLSILNLYNFLLFSYPFISSNIYPIFANNNLFVVYTKKLISYNLVIECKKENNFYIRNLDKTFAFNNKSILADLRIIYLKTKFLNIKDFCSKLYNMQKVVCYNENSWEVLSNEWEMVCISDCAVFRVKLWEKIEVNIIEIYNPSVKELIEKYVNGYIEFEGVYLNFFEIFKSENMKQFVEKIKKQ